MFKRLRQLGNTLGARFVRRSGARAYLWIAAAVSVLILIDAATVHQIASMQRHVFDLLVSHRLREPAPDPAIVIVDIDEASLAAMAPRHGRWPWPNDVFAEFVTALEARAPKAIVFDILYSDRDVLRPQADAAFDAALTHSAHTYFPMLRLGPASDAQSQIRPSMLPGAHPLPGVRNEDLPLGLILPQLPAAIDNGRLGTHNVVPDGDGVIRRYPVYLAHAGWRLPALPTRVAEDLGAALPPGADFLINWRGKPFRYTYVSFADAYRGLVSAQAAAGGDDLARRWAGKIVVIGSTAPSLFDLKAAPVGTPFPGVEMLATAIDNLKNDDWLRELPRGAALAAGLLFVWVLAIALARHVRIDRFDRMFTVLQFSFIVVSFATLNFAPFYLDMSAPLTHGTLFFTLARLYARLSAHWLASGGSGASLCAGLGGRAHTTPAPGAPARFTVLAIRLHAPEAGERDRLQAVVDQMVTASPGLAGRVDRLLPEPGEVPALFDRLTLVYWTTLRDASAAAEAQALRAACAAALPAAQAQGRLAYAQQAGDLTLDADDWQTRAYPIILAAMATVGPTRETLSQRVGEQPAASQQQA